MNFLNVDDFVWLYLSYGMRWSIGSALDCRSRDSWFESDPGLT